jgi:cytosine deaminase
VQALIELREELRPWIDIQLVAFPQDGYLRYPNAISNLNRALSMGVDVVGGIPHFERSADQGTQSIKMLCEIAAVKGLMVDMHCDETDDPLSRHVESLAFETQRLGLHGYVTGSHLTSMHSMDNYYVSKLMPLMREAQLHVVANPLINITLQGRHDLYPKRRGMTRVKELLALGINVAMGHDCVMDPWYSLGSHDMLEVAHMGLHIAQMTGVSEMRQIFETVTQNAARVLRLENYGLDVGCNADLVVLQALDPIDALRRKATRLYVVRRGQIIARAEPMSSRLSLAGRELEIDWSNPTP